MGWVLHTRRLRNGQKFGEVGRKRKHINIKDISRTYAPSCHIQSGFFANKVSVNTVSTQNMKAFVAQRCASKEFSHQFTRQRGKVVRAGPTMSVSGYECTKLHYNMAINYSGHSSWSLFEWDISVIDPAQGAIGDSSICW